MQTLDRDEVSTVVAASPEEVYALVADVTRMPEFSPEVTSCTLAGRRDRSGGRRALRGGEHECGRQELEEPAGRHRGRARAGVRLHPHRALRRDDRLALPLRARGGRHAG